ncbi:MAG: adenylyltransferase/cytidyltransferase family protein [Thaumarchaeota archaeon]|nr:adenylyltransferase/cytidyltransferase family protein [Candidatus Calditenuaceae archaeon]MDW8043185.1 adenylyltransferase/cytidyltransferase family protein [Nitrososphaerota archaeon]
MRARTVLTTGAFEIVHPGHVFLLRHARRLAGRRGKVVVVLASDATIRQRKGREPVMSERERLEVLSSLKYVDRVIVGYTPINFEKVLRRVRPDVVLFGYDQTAIEQEFRRFCEERGIGVRIARAPRAPYTPNLSTTLILNRAQRNQLAGEQFK